MCFEARTGALARGFPLSRDCSKYLGTMPTAGVNPKQWVPRRGHAQSLSTTWKSCMDPHRHQSEVLSTRFPLASPSRPTCRYERCHQMQLSFMQVVHAAEMGKI